MNVFFKKFVPAVLAVAALTSCSTDDLQGAFSEVFGSSEGDLNVVVEDLQDETTGTTRAAFIKTGNVLKWQKDVDTISVYNSSLFVYDWYAFNGSTFEIDDLGPYVDEAAYALFPKSSVVTTAWDRLTGKVTAAIEIPQQLSYTEDNATVKDSVIYLSNIPMWGTAENDGEKGKVKATMYYTTGILKVTLKNAFSNQGLVDALLIRGWKDLNAANAIAEVNVEGNTGDDAVGDMQMCGGFLATLNKEVPQNTQLVATEETATTNSKLYVDLKNMVDTTTVVYIPVPANTYGHLIISAGKATRDANGKITAFTSKEVLKHYSNKEIVRAKIYAGTNKEYEKGTAIQNTGNTPSLVNALLKDFASNKGDVRITDNGTGLSVNSTAGDDKDDIIEIPNMTCDTLFIAPSKIVEGGTSSKLTIKDAEGAAYAGAVVVEVPQTAMDIDIQLKNAKVYLRGKFTTDGLEDESKAKAVNVKGVAGGKATLTVGNGVMKTYLKEVAPDAYIGDVTIAPYTTVKNVTIASIYAVTSKITVKGTVSGEVKALAAETEVSGEGTVATLTTSGDVTINASKEMEVIGTKIAMNEGKKLTLTAGYVKALEVAEKKTITIVNTEAKPTAIGTVTLNGADANKAKISDYTSTWCGATVDTSTGKPGADYKDATDIYTATQLALLNTAGNITLNANINLNNKAWTSKAFTGKTFNGNNKTISNFTIAAQPAKDATTDAQNAGFFSTITPAADDAEIKNLTFSNVAITTGLNNKNKLTNNIGILAGTISTATYAYKITNVNVAASKIGENATSKNENIGGLVGVISGTKAVTIAGTSKTKKGSVAIAMNGYANMGGLVGVVTSTVASALAVTNYTVTPTFTETASGNEANKDAKLGTIGIYVGSLAEAGSEEAAQTVTIGSSASGETMKPASNFVAGKRKTFGFFYNYSVNEEVLYRFYGSSNANGAVGYSPKFKSLSIDGKLYTSTVRYSDNVAKENMSDDTKSSATQDGTNTKEFYLNFFVKHGNTAWSSEQ